MNTPLNWTPVPYYNIDIECYAGPVHSGEEWVPNGKGGIDIKELFNVRKDYFRSLKPCPTWELRIAFARQWKKIVDSMSKDTILDMLVNDLDVDKYLKDENKTYTWDLYSNNKEDDV